MSLIRKALQQGTDFSRFKRAKGRPPANRRGVPTVAKRPPLPRPIIPKPPKGGSGF